MTSTTPLIGLATELIRIRDDRRTTPVLVTPNYLALRPAFYVGLAEALFECDQTSVRYDWHRVGAASLLRVFGDMVAQRYAEAVNRSLESAARKTSHPARLCRMQVTSSIGRPSRKGAELIIGISDETLELPSWATPIALGDQQPSQHSHQLAPAVI